MELIRIKGLTKYARERIKQHGKGPNGDMFFLQKRTGNKILVRSMEKTWRGGSDDWAGWLIVGEDIEVIEGCKT